MRLTGNEEVDEKNPLSPENSSCNMGAIPKSSDIISSAANEKKKNQEKEVDSEPTENEQESKPMSLSRKFVMFLSLNCGVLFVAFFAVILPCRQELIPHVNASSTNFENSSVSSNITVLNEDLTGAMVFGYLRENEIGRGVTCEFAGSLPWKIQLDFIPTGCHCKTVDVNDESYFDCILPGKLQRAILKSSEGNESRRQVFFNNIFVPDSKERWILQNCVWEEMCLFFITTRGIRTVSIVIKNEETEIPIRNFAFPCGRNFDRKTKWLNEIENSEFFFRCL